MFSMTRRKKVTLNIAIGVVLISILSSAASAQAVVQGTALLATAKLNNLRLHTSGPWIKDVQGNTVTLRGAEDYLRWEYADASHNFDPLRYSDISPQKYDLYRQSGANFIRVHMNKWLWDSSPNYVKAYDTLIEWTSQRGIRVVINFESYTIIGAQWPVYDWTQEQVIDYLVNGTTQTFLTQLANHFKNKDNVIGFEIMPDRIADTFWASYRGETPQQARAEYRQAVISIIRAIHAVDPTFLAFIYPICYVCLISFIQESPITEPNTVWAAIQSVSWDKCCYDYAKAYYNGSTSLGYSLMASFYQQNLFYATELGYPVILLETEAKTDLPSADQYVADLFTIFRQNQIGICWWPYDIPQGTSGLWGWINLLQLSGTRLKLTPIGRVWAKHLQLFST